jgi:ubiquinone/menaquinone biosynthesis C-methylase UbiE
MLHIYKNKIEKLNLSGMLSCEHSDVENLDLEKNYYDIIASTVTLHHVRTKLPVIRNIYNILKPGGTFIIGDIDMDTTGNVRDPKRLMRIIGYLKEEYALAIKEGGVEAFSRMYDNGKKHILNDGEYCVSFKQWAEICRKAKFKKIAIKPLREFEWFKVLIAVK